MSTYNREPLAAAIVLAPKGPLAGVSAHVHCQSTLMDEFLAAFYTNEWAIVRVNAAMPL
jgi:hypothetical protein